MLERQVGEEFMCVTDPIADMITRMRNAMAVRKESVLIPVSKLKERILNVLINEGYVESYEREYVGKVEYLKVILKYYMDKPVITHLKRISKPGCRLYSGFRNLKKVRGGLGISVVSTSYGVLSNEEAMRRKLGGEVLIEVF